MRVSARNLILLLLCCLLPLQGTLAFARSVGMISHHARLLQTAPLTRHTDSAQSATDHTSGGHQQAVHAHHATQAQHAGSVAPASANKSAKISAPVSKQSRHSPASCTDCGKCCLMGAAAPPPAVMQAPAVSFVLLAFTFNRPAAAGHIPEKPERPPRLPAHFLT